jgi:membrane-associated protease RseP (regulator of RpoE activity)
VLLLLGLLGLAGGACLLVLANAAARYACVLALGVRGARFTLGMPEWQWVTASGAPRLLTLLAGVAGSYLVSSVPIAVGLLASGVDRTDPTTRVHVVRGSAADRAGLVDDDRIVAVDGVKVSDWDGLRAAAQAARDRTVRVDFLRSGAPSSATVDLPDGHLGVTAVHEHASPTLGEAVAVGLATPATMWTAMARGLVEALGGRERPTELAGPVAAIREAPPSQGIQAGLALRFIGIVSSYGLPMAIVYAIVTAPTGRRSKRPG